LASYRHSLRGQRRSKEDQANLENQQDGQSRISEPIPPEMDRAARVIDDD
jgi:hypothetical protein